MNILSQLYTKMEESFNKYLKNHFVDSNYWNKESDINNYYSFMNGIDNFSNKFILDIIKLYFEHIDDVFFNTSYRKKNCISKGFYNRTILTLHGEVTFKRRYYFDYSNNERFFFTDMFLNFPKYKYFDPYICSKIFKNAASFSYSKAGNIVSEAIGKKINDTFNISRATARNIVMNFNPIIDVIKEEKKVLRLDVMLDEKFIGSQFNKGKDIMIKAAVISEGSELVYKYKKKKTSMNRFKLINSHTCASINNNLLNDVIDYIYNTYDTDYLKEINFMGDCAKWIKIFPQSHWFKFNKDIKINFAMDGFHFAQALKQLTTNKHTDVYDALLEYVNQNNKKDFIRLCDEFSELCPNRIETIENKKNYILNNWKARQLYKNNPHLKCSMESHISHIFADLFSSRPKAYSKKGLNKLLTLRLLKENGVDLEQLYLSSLLNKEKTTTTYSSSNYNYNDYNVQAINFLKLDTTISFI